MGLWTKLTSRASKEPAAKEGREPRTPPPKWPIPPTRRETFQRILRATRYWDPETSSPITELEELSDRHNFVPAVLRIEEYFRRPYEEMAGDERQETHRLLKYFNETEMCQAAARRAGDDRSGPDERYDKGNVLYDLVLDRTLRAALGHAAGRTPPLPYSSALLKDEITPWQGLPMA
jgi:hypothetical protein